VSPDGEFILATQEKTFFNLWTVSVNRGDLNRQLTSSSELRHGDKGIAWTPDGKYLVYSLMSSNAHGDIAKINVETGDVSRLTDDKQSLNLHPQVTPDGTSVIFTSTRDGGTHIWKMDLEGGSLSRLTDGVGESFSRISADGKWLYYASPAWNPEALWKRSLEGNGADVKILSSAAGSNAPSPDGRHIVVSYRSSSDDGEVVFKYGIVSHEPVSIPKELDFNPLYGAIAWKPDGSGFYYLKDQGRSLSNIWEYDLGSKEHKQITDLSGRMASLALSPDGSTLATARGETISNIFKISVR
jgi:Tol biopolymer transport system component